MKEQLQITEIADLILISTCKYNNTIHSSIKEKPIDVFQNFEPETKTDKD
jgi:hypothetical protein